LRFTESISKITVHDKAKFLIICFETKIYIYTKNGTELFDILEDVKRPELCDSIALKTDQENLVIACLREGKDQIEFYYSKHGDFLARPRINTYPLGEIGKIVLNCGQNEPSIRVSVISSDGKLVYVYELEWFDHFLKS